MTYKTKYVMKDGQGRSTSKTLHYSGLPANELADSQALLATLVGVSDIGVTKTIQTQQAIYVDAASIASAGALSNKDEGISLSVTLEGGVSETMKLPSPSRDVAGLFEYITNGIVDVANPAIIAYVSQFAVNGFGANIADGKFTLANGLRVVTLDSGVLDA